MEMRDEILKRWRALREGSGITRAHRVMVIMRFAGFIIFAMVFAGVAFGLHPVILATLGILTGWLVAEANALHTRLSQWPIIKDYIDWNRVNADCKFGNDKQEHNGTEQRVGTIPRDPAGHSDVQS